MEEALKILLDSWMKEHGYYYTVCFDTGVRLNLGNIEKEKIYIPNGIMLYRILKGRMKKIMKI